MVATLALPLFAIGAEVECCCGDECACDPGTGMSCDMEITQHGPVSVLPLSAAPLNKVEIDQLDGQQGPCESLDEVFPDPPTLLDYIDISSAESPPGSPLPLLI